VNFGKRVCTSGGPIEKWYKHDTQRDIQDVFYYESQEITNYTAMCKLEKQERRWDNSVQVQRPERDLLRCPTAGDRGRSL
jgi:hypothetical protein